MESNSPETSSPDDGLRVTPQVRDSLRSIHRCLFGTVAVGVAIVPIALANTWLNMRAMPLTLQRFTLVAAVPGYVIAFIMLVVGFRYAGGVRRQFDSYSPPNFGEMFRLRHRLFQSKVLTTLAAFAIGMLIGLWAVATGLIHEMSGR